MTITVDALVIDHRVAPFGGVVLRFRNGDELRAEVERGEQRFLAGVVERLAEGFQDGSVWERIERAANMRRSAALA